MIDVGVGQQAGQVGHRAHAVATGPRDPDETRAERSQALLDRAPDRAEAEDQYPRAVDVEQVVDVFPAMLGLSLRVRAGALVVGEDRGHDPFRHRAVARAGRIAQRDSVGDPAEDPVDAGGPGLHQPQRGQRLEVETVDMLGDHHLHLVAVP